MISTDGGTWKKTELELLKSPFHEARLLALCSCWLRGTQKARAKSLWERRIGIMSTFRFIKAADFADTLAPAELLLNDREDLIHKAVGWMLRHAIEKFPEGQRQAFLQGSR